MLIKTIATILILLTILSGYNPSTIKADENYYDPLLATHIIIADCGGVECSIEEYNQYYDDQQKQNEPQYSESYDVINEAYTSGEVRNCNYGCVEDTYSSDTNFLMMDNFYFIILPVKYAETYPIGATLEIEFTDTLTGEIAVIPCIVGDYRQYEHGETIGFSQSDSSYNFEGQWTARIIL